MPTGPQFGLASAAYRAYRPEYPGALFARIFAHLPAEAMRRAVDLGAGTGLSVKPLCGRFAEVIAVEPDAAMAESLRSIDRDVLTLRCAAEECSLPPGSVNLVTSGNAFYWMDAARVLPRVAQWLGQQGVLAVYRGGFPRVAGRAGEILAREMREHWEEYRAAILRDEGHTERAIRASNLFAEVAREEIPHVLEWSAAQVAGFCSSTSYGSAYMRTLGEPQQYLRRLEAELEAATGGRPILMDFGLELILAKKNT